MKTCFPLLLALAGAAACSDSSVTGPAPLGRVVAASTVAGAPVATRITVMTQNLYLGADVDLVIGALLTPDPNDDVAALQVAIATLGKTDFPARAEALADEIARARPHVLGLQEVEDLHIHLGALGLPVDIDQNFLEILQGALAARGLANYAVAGQVTNVTATLFFGAITLLDHDAILVDEQRVDVLDVREQNFQHNLPLSLAGVDFKRGWVQIDASIAGLPLTIANTHLESGSGGFFPGLRVQQAGELTSAVSGAPAAILLGDFNDPPDSPMHAVITGAGFTDAWAALRPGAAGFTCCEPADLSNQVATLTGRFDDVFVRGISGPRGKLLGQITIVGDQPGDRVPGPLYPVWPSDHAGVVASVLLPPAQGLAAR